MPHHCARRQILKSATSRRATGEHRLDAWSSFKSWGFNRASTRFFTVLDVAKSPSMSSGRALAKVPKAFAEVARLVLRCFFFPQQKHQKHREPLGTPWDPLGPSHTSGMGSTRVTLSCGIRRSRYGWMSLASCSAKDKQLGNRWENDGKYNSSVRDVIEIRNAHSQEIQTIRPIRLDKS